MSPELMQPSAYASFNRPQNRQHGHTVNEVRLRRPGRLGTFLVTSDETRPVLFWRSTSWR
jgi:hypothetical protein